MAPSHLIQAAASICTSALLALILLGPTGCNQDGLSEFPTSLDDVSPHVVKQLGGLHFVNDPSMGYQLASQQGLPCLMFFTANWCTYCHDMEETAFRDPTVETLAEGFVCIMVDADREPGLCQKFAVSGFPTIQFIAADGRILHRLVGRQTASSLATGMRAASQRFAWLNGESPTIQ